MGLASALAAQTSAQPASGHPHAHPAPSAGYPPTAGYPPAPGYPPAAGHPPASGYPPAAAYPPPAGTPQQMPQQMPAQHVPWGLAPPQQQSQQQGMASVIAAKLHKIVSANQLQHFYTPERLQAVTTRVLQRVDFHALAQKWRMPTELAVDLAALALYDIVIYADDSGSMESDNGERIEDLKLIMSKVAEVATLFDEDGIEVRFINSNAQGNGIKSAADASRLLSGLEYRWDTKLATFMEEKILKPMAYNKPLNKPLLIITITDGEPSDKPQDKIAQTILDARTRLAGRYGPGAVAFQFAQVGKDREAQEFLARLDKHPQVGSMIDCTSYYELESAEYAAKGITLSVEAWLVKLMVGAIDPEYDEQDEGPAAARHQQQYGSAAPAYPPAGGAYGPAGGAYGPAGGYPGSAYPPTAGAYPPQQQQFAYPPQQQPAAAHHKPKKGFLQKLFS